ncbi:unnamed protein product [Nippostrongylus brasiliensis]|uniref:XK-related protein n=1 Tax=Nippostrongylus brasiliensis TaxID=27835 RepID=A0A0N4XHA9_NIPBR|nr:unnamed protein product [Nippostrongylus brasiliensis]
MILFLLGTPAVVFERFLATYFLEDYDRNPRLYFGYIIVTCQLLFAALASYTFHTANSTIPHVVVVIVVNGCSAIANTVIRHVNLRHYKRSMKRKHIRSYTLGERYQIAENIHICEFVFKCILWIGFLNIISTLALIVDNIDVAIIYQNVAVILFNYCLLTYGFLIAFVMYWYNDRWQIELKRILKSLHMRRNSEPAPVSVKSTLGVETNINKELQGPQYFLMLRKEWS